MKSPKKVIKHIVDWLIDYCDKSKMKGFVIGVSGGIDSAVVSTLCALTKKNVLCLDMSIHQNTNEIKRSSEHISWLEKKFPNVNHFKISLSEVFDTFKNKMPFIINENKKKLLSLANSRARLRMTTLYYFATINNYLVAGTGNKVEDFGVGFFTKYGDGGVDISPIADLIKTEVYAIAKDLEIINSIQIAAPTDGLWPDNRTDEDQFGVTYKELEWAMKICETKIEKKIFSKRQKLVLKTFKINNKNNKHKMTPIPVCIIPSNLLK
jgi:NAD+ synthase